ncbi:ROK family transcriptional regulator [Paracoccus tegillarcae]|uniref:ROK family transcriptional regulator n=1 Tax=Paracoccus tegillarcae TaxID=1529068 RepID=A0A2K9EAY6_9RHOB|nr:ROK family transcriptional regulator [Paracoccus tegillarcae]AUH32048.1 ROK family transcriptional regulator [Paracoccus tegillarcae]
MRTTAGEAAEISNNERLFMAILRRDGPKSRAEIAAATGLSAQSATNISRQLIDAGLIAQGEVVRGKVGQPSTPLSLAPDGALFLGLKVGRRMAELALVDFTGTIRMHRQEVYDHPEPDRLLRFARSAIAAIIDNLPPEQAGRIAGLGIATPFQLWDWGCEMAGWRNRDLRAEMADGLLFPVWLENDGNCACAAELVFGRSELPADFLYIYVAHFAGGGMVLDGRLRLGPRRNAGAIGSMPARQGGQVLDHASVSRLETMIGHTLPPDNAGWTVPPEIEADWARQSGEALAWAATSALALADLRAVLIDGAVPRATRDLLIAATQEAMTHLPLAGLEAPPILPGTLGRAARTLGAAALPLSHVFLPDGAPGALASG